MGLFNKKKKNAVVEAINQEALQAEETQKTSQAVDGARVTLEEIKDALKRLDNDRGLSAAMKIAADKNDLRAKSLEEAEENFERTESKAPGKKRTVSIFDLEKGLYITTEDLDSYVISLHKLYEFFDGKSAAETVMTGADKINVYLKQFISSLDEALRSGKKLKANACIDVLKYTLIIGYKNEDISDPEKLENRLNEKVSFVKDTCTELLATIDRYYENIAMHEVEEYAYYEAHKNFVKQYDEIMAIPEDIRNTLDNLGFKRAMKELPPGDEARSFMPLIQVAQASATKIAYHSITIEALMLQLVALQSDIDELITECKKAYKLGAVFDYTQHKKTMMAIRKKSLERVNKMNDMAAESQRMNEETMSLINESANNVALGQAISDSLKTINKMAKIDRKNTELNKQINERKTALQQEKEAMNVEIQTRAEEDKRELIDEMM